MKLNRKGFLIVATAAYFAVTVNTQTSQAGQWLDSILGRRPPVYPVGTPVPLNGQVAAFSQGAYPSLGYIPPSYANLNSPQTLGYGSYMSPPANNAPLLPPGFPQTVAAQLPTAAYDTQWARTPVTYYRPVTAFDPRYGTTVTSLQPCTSYQYQAQRQPVLALRPLLGEYGLQANRWPSITGPGYNPTGLVNAPTYPAYQSIPNGGMPAFGQPAIGQPVFGQPVFGQPVFGQPNAVPVGGAGVSSGMPASTMPLTTMPYNPANVGAYASQQAYYAGQAFANPTYATNYSSSASVGLPTQAVGSGVVATAAWLPTTPTCADGMCPQTTGQMNTPNIPGAASVVPVGPPTYSALPNTNPNTNLPAYSAPPVLPNFPVMPSNNNPGSDPEAERRPELGRKMSSNFSRIPSESAPNVQSIPMVAIDREATPRNGETAAGFSNPDGSFKPRDSLALGNSATNSLNKDESSGIEPRVFDGAPQIPQTLAPRGDYGMKPLNAPEELDSNPRWTPTLLEPDDRVAMERAASANRRGENKRIRIREDQESVISAVVMNSSKSNRNSIQLVSGVETKKTESVDAGVIRFRPVTKLK